MNGSVIVRRKEVNTPRGTNAKRVRFQSKKRFITKISFSINHTCAHSIDRRPTTGFIHCHHDCTVCVL